MSSWTEPTVRPTHGKSEWLSICKVCRHGIYKGRDEYVTLTNPMGMVHAGCVPVHVVRAIFEITDASRTKSALVAEASAALDVMAARAGARIVGVPVWTVAGDKLVCDAPAVSTQPVDLAADPDRRDAEVRRLGGLGWSLRQIGEVLGVPHSTVRDVLGRGAA